MEKLELKHISPYLPYGLKVQYEGIINGSELSDFDKAFNESLEKESKLLLDRPDEKIDFKIGKIRRIEFWDRWANIWVGNKRPKRVLLNEIKPILRPLSDLCKEIDGEIPADILFPKEYYSLVDFYEEYNRENQIQSFIKDGLNWCETYSFWEYLLSKHFDVFSLIDKGLAVDINSISHE